MRTLNRVLAGAAVLAGVVACNDAATDPLDESSLLLSSAFTSVPLGYSQALHSYNGADSAWAPGDSGRFGDGRGGPGGHGGRGGPGGGRGGRGGRRGHGPAGGDLFGPGLMGGGLRGDFFGGVGFGRGFDHGPFGGALPTTCAFSAATGRVSCDPVTSNGLTLTRSAAYSNAAGTAQSAPDSTTNTVNLRIAVAGTKVHRNGDTSVVQHASDRTVGGLAVGSTQRTVNGTSAGTETRSGTSDSLGHYVAVRTIGDTATGLVVPVENGRPTYPTAGTVVRSMTVTVTFDGQTPTTTSRREVVTYDGTSTAKVVITKDGTTKTCTLPLPRGRLTCE